MKFFYLSCIAMVFFSACDDSCPTESFTPCIQQRIDAFKQDPSAESIIKIDRPGSPLFWFVDIEADGVEDVVTADCSFVCITDCECITEHLCDNAIFDFPRTVIWSK
jgi:hypothetical protein